MPFNAVLQFEISVHSGICACVSGYTMPGGRGFETFITWTKRNGDLA